MKKFYLLFLPLLAIGAYAQNFPVAIDDTAQVMNQKLIEIYPLLNDYDPDGDTIEISYFSGINYGESWFEDSIVYYKSEPHTGWVYGRYKVAETENPGSQSEHAFIRVKIIENPDIPVAVEDSLHAKFLEPTILYPMYNDYDPNGDSIMIEEVEYWAHYCDVELSEDSTYVIVTSEYAPDGYAWFEYRVVEINTSERYYSHYVDVIVYLDENENLPIAVNDSLVVTGGIPSILGVLENDYNPSGDTLEFFEVSDPWHGKLTIEENTLNFTADTSYTGETEFEYSIRYKHDTSLYSQSAVVKIFVNKNPNCPIGEPDSGEGMSFTPIAVEVLSNDIDPLGDPIEVFDVKSKYNPGNYTSIYFSGDTVTYIPPAAMIGRDTAHYKIRKVNNHAYSSDWIPILYEVSQNPELPTTHPDSAITFGGVPIMIDIMSNDIIPDSLPVQTLLCFPQNNMGVVNVIGDSIIKYTPYYNSAGIDSLIYSYLNYSHPSLIVAIGKVYIKVINNHSYDSLFINNINAGVSTNGNLFSSTKYTENIYAGYRKQHFEVPKGSGNQLIYNNSMWIGGLTESGELHFTGKLYYPRGADFKAGPISDYRDSAFVVDWQRSWKLTKNEVQYHRNNWWKEGYEPLEAITKWPGNGDHAYGMAEQIAPFYDNDNNNIYDPEFGDCPYIRGDECIYFICNDDNTHTDDMADSLRVEVHCMVYAFDDPGDSILNNTIFVHYDLINRSQNTYFDTYFGTYTHFSIGFEYDDYLGSSVTGNSFFAYNGRDIDGGIYPTIYGDKPPAQSVTILAGPYMDPDGEDNPSGGCDYSVNGVNFNNGITDDERIGLSHFLYINDGPGIISYPDNAHEQYLNMRGFWRDDCPVIFGGWGWEYPYPGTDSSTPCRYMYPGDTDPLNWGTECMLPNGGYNQNGKWWTEEDEDHSLGWDRSGVGSCGPFTFLPGDVQEVDMAYVFANSYYSADSSKNLLIDRLYDLRQRVLNGEIVIPNDELDINEHTQNAISFELYPNPANDMIRINPTGKFAKAEYKITNTMGTLVQSGILSTEINISGLKPGLYIITIITEKEITSNKFIKY